MGKKHLVANMQQDIFIACPVDYKVILPNGKKDGKLIHNGKVVRRDSPRPSEGDGMEPIDG